MKRKSEGAFQLAIMDLEPLQMNDPWMFSDFSDVPITVEFGASVTDYLLEKKIFLTVGESCHFSFTDHSGEKVEVYIQDVSLIDIWKIYEKIFLSFLEKKRLMV